MLLAVTSLLGLVTSQQPPPNYSYDALPETSFSCAGRVVGGYYADVEAGCQMFHVCGTSQVTARVVGTAPPAGRTEDRRDGQCRRPADGRTTEGAASAWRWPPDRRDDPWTWTAPADAGRLPTDRRLPDRRTADEPAED